MNMLQQAEDAAQVSRSIGAPDGVLRLESAGDGRLYALVAGRRVLVTVRQCFPWSEPRRYLSLRDTEESEVALVDDPDALDAESRQALEQGLAEAGFVLEVVRVVSIDEEVEIRHWVVETPHGRRTFQTHLDQWPRVLPTGDLLIRDVAGDLYRLADPARLDRHSRALLWSFVD